MKHFHSLRFPMARLSKATAAFMLVMLASTLRLLAGGGLIPVHSLGNPLVINSITTSNVTLYHDSLNAPKPILMASLRLYYPDRSDAYQNVIQNAAPMINAETRNWDVNDNLPDMQEDRQPTPQTRNDWNPLDNVNDWPASSDPKSDIEIAVVIDLEEENEVEVAQWADAPALLTNINRPQLHLEDNVILPLPGEATAADESTEKQQSEELPSLGLTAWPNPTTGMFRASLQGGNGGKTHYRIISQNGQLIQSFDAEAETVQLDLSGQPAGIYHLQVVQGGTALTSQILLQR